MSMLPPTRTWRWTNKAGEERDFVQSELTIDGEIQLFGLVNRAVALLAEAKFPFNEITKAFPASDIDPDSPQIDWPAATHLLSIALPIVPNMVSELASILLGQFPTDEFGKPNREFVADVAFLRSVIKMADVVEMLQTFAEQNDVERMIAPFVGRVRTALTGSPRIAAVPSGKPSTSSSPTATATPEP